MRHPIAALALMSLAACGHGGSGNVVGPANVAAASPAPAPPTPAATAPAPAAAPGTGGVDAAYLIGKWTEDGHCDAVVTFNADGSFTFPWGDGGRWTLAGDRLTLTGNSGDLHVTAADHDHMATTYPDGSVHHSTRC